VSIRSLAATLVCLPIALAASTANAADPYKIDVVTSLTGGASFLGKGEQQSLQLLEKSVNKAGGINGRPLELVFYDDQSSPQVAVQLDAGTVNRRDVQCRRPAHEGWPGHVLPVAGNSSAEGQLRIHLEHLDLRSCQGAHAPLPP
jgi:hypothetical protein